MGKQRMSMRDAMDLVPDDMPDGAYWALVHEFAGVDYGDGFEEVVATIPLDAPKKKVWKCDAIERRPTTNAAQSHKRYICKTCGKRFKKYSAGCRHWQAKHTSEAA